ncbi:MAG: hypothetical protein HY922_05490 [Elusimicrobia bacterium]|nr:hypothetical protein [Elusimicrobiota bacterium]
MRTFLLLGLLAAPSCAVEVEPLLSLKFLGGQYFFQGQKGALSGNVSALFAPAVRLDERWAVLPSVSGSYQGTKQVIDLVGAGTLFQEQMDYRVAAKTVYQGADSLWRLKGGLGYKLQLLKETKDEDWGRGLFDYRTLDIGLEAEYVYRDPFSLRVGYDYAWTYFPNYDSLESEAAFDFQGRPLARELVGDAVLNTHANMLTAALDVPLKGVAAVQAGLRLMQQIYPNQPVVAPSGQLMGEKRTDYQTAFDASLKVPFAAGPDIRIAACADASVSNLISNQNSYDARAARWLDRFYNHTQVGAGAGLQFLFGDERLPIEWSLGASWSRRSYPHRPIQDESGLYQDESLRQRSWLFSTTLKYPMAPRFALMFNFQHGQTASNQGCRLFYSAGYRATNYLFGFTYDY